MALDKFHAEHAKDPNDEALRKAGRNPDSWREHRVFPLAELDPAVREAILAGRRSRRTGQPPTP